VQESKIIGLILAPQPIKPLNSIIVVLIGNTKLKFCTWHNECSL